MATKAKLREFQQTSRFAAALINFLKEADTPQSITACHKASRNGDSPTRRTVSSLLREACAKHIVEKSKGVGRQQLFSLRSDIKALLQEGAPQAEPQSIAAFSKNLFYRRFWGPNDVERLSEVLPNQQKRDRLRSRIRFVADWIGRNSARIKENVLETSVLALAKQRPISLTYRDRRDLTQMESTQKQISLSPLGIVVKDGGIYLVGADANIAVKTIPLHRVTEANIDKRVEFKNIDNFSLDDYIEETNNFSHQVDGYPTPLELEMLVEAQSIYHFKERPLPGQQEPEKLKNGKYLVKATLPMTVLLVPFLLSMGPWIQVVGPEALVKEMAWRIKRMAKHYDDPPDDYVSPFDTNSGKNAGASA